MSIANWQTGEARSGEDFPVTLSRLDGDGAQRLIYYPMGMLYRLRAFVSPETGDVSVRMTLRWSEMVSYEPHFVEARASRAFQETVPEGRVLVVRIPIRRYRLVGYRQGRLYNELRYVWEDKEEIVLEPVDPDSAPEGYVFALIEADVINMPSDEGAPVSEVLLPAETTTP